MASTNPVPGLDKFFEFSKSISAHMFFFAKNRTLCIYILKVGNLATLMWDYLLRSEDSYKFV